MVLRLIAILMMTAVCSACSSSEQVAPVGKPEPYSAPPTRSEMVPPVSPAPQPLAKPPAPDALQEEREFQRLLKDPEFVGQISRDTLSCLHWTGDMTSAQLRLIETLGNGTQNYLLTIHWQRMLMRNQIRLLMIYVPPENFVKLQVLDDTAWNGYDKGCPLLTGVYGGNYGVVALDSGRASRKRDFVCTAAAIVSALARNRFVGPAIGLTCSQM